MAESSLFAQRLQAITERRRLQERILATRRELEEERLRAERLKRKSLRDRWLMEGTSIPSEDNEHKPFWEAQTRIQELEQDLSSLQSQMQKLDHPELRQGRQQLEDSARAVKEVDGMSSPPEGRSGSESRLELAPVPPKKPPKTAAKEKLQNGDMLAVGLYLAAENRERRSQLNLREKGVLQYRGYHGEGMPRGDMKVCLPNRGDTQQCLSVGSGQFGSEFSSDKVNIMMNPVVADGEDLPSCGISCEAAPATKPAWQSLDPSEAPAGRQRKLAVEEMVIRDHLGQEVGSMDAVGQKQRSIGKEEEMENHTLVGNGPSPLCCLLDQEKAPGAVESQLDNELGSRDGPEGESPTSQDQQSPSKPLQNENSSVDSPKRQPGGGLEMASLDKEATLQEVGQKELPEQSAKEAKPAQDLATGDDPSAKHVRSGQEDQGKKQGLQEHQGSEMTVAEPGGEKRESWLDKSAPLLPAHVPSGHEAMVPSSLEEAKIPFLDPVLSSSLPDQIPLTLSGQIPCLQDAKGFLLDQIPSSLQEREAALWDPALSLPNQSPSTLLNQNPPLQESKDSPLCQIPSSFQEPLPDTNPPSQRDYICSSPEQKQSSFQGEISSEQEAKPSLLEHIASPLHETDTKLLDQVPTALQDQSVSLPDEILSPLSDQFASLPEVESTLPEQIPPSLHETERSLQMATMIQSHKRPVQETKESLSDMDPSLATQLSSLSDKTTSFQEAEDIPLGLRDQKPTPSEAQIHSVPDHIPASVDEDKHLLPSETPTSVPDQIPLALQDQQPTLVEGNLPPSLQEAGRSPDQTQAPLPRPGLSTLSEAQASSSGQTHPTLIEQLPTTSLQEQAPSLQKVEEALPKISSSVPEETPALPDRASSPNKVRSPALQDTVTFPDVLPLSSQEPVQPPLDTTASVENQDLKEGGDASLALAAAEVTDMLENPKAEQQPLLKESTASVAPPDISVGDPQPKAGILKPQVAASQEAPTYTTTSANTASSCHLQPAVRHQEEGQDQGQSRRKQKSCQCCSVM